MSPEILVSAAAILLSLLFSYVPGFGSWYQPLAADKKRLIMLGFLAVLSLGAYGLSCVGWAVAAGLECTSKGAFELVKIFVAAIIANQAIYAVSPQDTKQRESWVDKAEARQGAKAEARKAVSRKDK